MNRSRSCWLAATISLLLGGMLFCPHLPGAEPAAQQRRTRQAWTRTTAQVQLLLNRHDPYLQYVVLQLARREGKLADAIPYVELAINGWGDWLTGGLGEPGGRQATHMYATRFYCPEGGQYTLTPDGLGCTCSIHGSPRDPRQSLAPAEDSELARLMRQFADLTAALTFLEDGLRAVVVIQKK